MNKKVVLHITFLLLATIITFFWVTNEKLNYHSVQLTASLLIILIITHRVLKPDLFKLVESVISTIAVLLITSSTGGVVSPLFFLAFFLLFELSLLLEPIIPLILSFAFIFFYFLVSDFSFTTLHWFALLAFPYMTPLAIAFGQTYQKVQNQKKEIKNLEKKVEELKEELVEEELNNPINTNKPVIQ